MIRRTRRRVQRRQLVPPAPRTGAWWAPRPRRKEMSMRPMSESERRRRSSAEESIA